MKRTVLSLLAVVVLIASGAAEARVKKSGPKARQTQKVSVVTSPGNMREIQMNIRSASLLAENLDARAGQIIDAMSKSRWEKWLRGIDEDRMKAEYAEDLMIHMSRMTSLFRSHRKTGPFARFNEFEFQNLLVKSDYLLSLAVSRQSLEFAHHKELFKTRFNSALAAYNTERVGFDQKMIRFSFAANNQ